MCCQPGCVCVFGGGVLGGMVAVQTRVGSREQCWHCSNMVHHCIQLLCTQKHLQLQACCHPALPQAVCVGAVRLQSAPQAVLGEV